MLTLGPGPRLMERPSEAGSGLGWALARLRLGRPTREGRAGPGGRWPRRDTVNEWASGRAGEHLLDAEDAETAAASCDAVNGGGQGRTGSWRRRRDPAVPGRIWPGTTARSCVGAPRGQWQLLLPEERREREIQRGNRERRRTRRKQRRDAAVLLVLVAGYGADEAAIGMRALLLLEGDEGAATDRRKRLAMVSCGGNRER